MTASGEPPPELGIRDEADVRVLTLQRPERRNALSRTLIAALHEAFAGIGETDGTRAVVLAGIGPVFCAGGDIAEYAAAAGGGDATANADALGRLLAAIVACPVPVIARVHGDAYGGGVGLVCAADIVVAARTARFSLSEARLGLAPAAIAPYVLRAMGERLALAAMLLAEPFDADAALASGLVHRLVEPAQLDETVAALVGQLRKGAPGALAAIKRLPRLLDGRDEAGQQAVVVALHARRVTSDEGREGLTAFLEKRSPAWATTAEPPADGGGSPGAGEPGPGQ